MTIERLARTTEIAVVIPMLCALPVPDFDMVSALIIRLYDSEDSAGTLGGDDAMPPQDTPAQEMEQIIDEQEPADAVVDMPAKKPRKRSRNKANIEWITLHHKVIVGLLKRGASPYEVGKILTDGQDSKKLEHLLPFEDEYSREWKEAIASWKCSQMKLVEQTDGI